MIPSVTEVIGPWIDKTWYDEAGLIRGSAVHQAIAAELKGLWFPGIDSAYKGYYESFYCWKIAYVKEVILVEEELTDDEMGFHGHPDLYCLMADGAYTIPDYKTSASTQKWWRVQIATYKHLLEKKGHRVDRAGALKLFPDGRTAKFVEVVTDPHDLAAFFSCLNAWRYFNP